MFNEWSVSFDLQVDVDLIAAETIKKILDDAGAFVGLGDFRPAKKGPYSRFQVTSWELVK